MNSRERLLRTINGEKTDRVPVTLFIQDHGHFIHQLYPDIDPLDYESLTKKVVDYQRSLGCDVFARMIFDLYHPLEICLGGVNVGEETSNWKVEITETQEGKNFIRKAKIATPEGELTQEFVRTQQNKGTYVYCCTEKPIKNINDLKIAKKYEPGITEAYAKMVKEKITAIKDYIGDDGILGTWVPGGPFNNASMIIDHNELYMLFMTDAEYFELLMEYCIDRTIGYTKAFIEAGADVMLVGGNVPGGFLGADVYEQFILPHEKKYIDFIQSTGTPAVYHNCGEIMNLVDSYKKLGSKIIEPFSPVPLGDADLEKAVDIIKGDYITIGGIDQVNVLQKASKEKVIETAKELVETGKKHGRFIAQSADFLEYNTPVENIEAFVQTALKHASY